MSGSKDLWQAYSEDCQPIKGQGLTRQQARDGALHGAAHTWLWRKKDGHVEILIQKRAKNKPTWAGFYDISAAGHIDLGETPLIAALRETKEEIGLSLKAEELQPLFVYRANQVDDTSGYIENEVQHVYGFEVKKDLKFKPAKSEVDELKWVSLDKFKDLVDGKTKDKIVLQGGEYFDNLLEHIK